MKINKEKSKMLAGSVAFGLGISLFTMCSIASAVAVSHSPISETVISQILVTSAAAGIIASPLFYCGMSSIDKECTESEKNNDQFQKKLK